MRGCVFEKSVITVISEENRTFAVAVINDHFPKMSLPVSVHTGAYQQAEKEEGSDRDK